MGNRITPRGVRNNNPLNIRKGIHWKGLASPPDDGSFCRFSSMQYGIRAALILLRNYVSGHNSAKIQFNTIPAIIRRWAPPSENATSKYIDFVVGDSGIRPDRIIYSNDQYILCRLAQSMAFVECGQRFDLDDFYSAWNLI